MTLKSYDTLPDESVSIRTAVFVEEQGFKEEFDDIDDISTHIVAFDLDKPVGNVRFFFDRNKGKYIIGRLAVLKNYRSFGVGAMLIKEAERLAKEKGASEICLHSQVQAKQFYIKQGYTEFGEQDFDEDCPHQWMKKNL